MDTNDAGKFGGVGGGAQGSAQARLFLRRLNHLKDKLEKEMDYMNISRMDLNDHVPKGGKRILEEERDRRKR